MMRRRLRSIGILLLGLCLVAAGFVYDVQYAGIPYQDPTAEQQAQYDLHSSIASRVRSAGGILMLAGFLLFIYQVIGFLWRRRGSKA
jgi:cbb3-type cytochrome oxidase subunit 1